MFCLLMGMLADMLRMIRLNIERLLYYEKFGKILEPAQLIRLVQLENKADALMKHDAATRVPFLQ